MMFTLFVFLGLVIFLFIGLHFYLNKQRTWVKVPNVTYYLTGDLISIEGEVYKVTAVDYINYRIQIKPTILQFLGGIFWRS